MEQRSVWQEPHSNRLQRPEASGPTVEKSKGYPTGGGGETPVAATRQEGGEGTPVAATVLQAREHGHMPPTHRPHDM